jgi:hypothetical protein
MSNKHFDDHCEVDEKKYSKCFKEVDKVCIGCPKPCITSILEGFVKVEIKDHKIEKDCNGFNLIVTGCKYIKVKYCSNDKCACNKIFTEIFVVPFKQCLRFCGCYMDLCDLDAYVEECSMEKINSRCVCVTSKICIEPDFEEQEYDCWDDEWDCSCDIKDCCCKIKDHCSKC